MTATATKPEHQDSGVLEDERSKNTLGLLRLAVIVLLIAGVTGVFDVGWNVLLVTAILVIVMVHELGHFVTARWAGMRVTDFFVGFGPTLWSMKRGDTRFGVKALPVGGFVRVIGMHNLEEVDPADEPYTYRAKTYWQRLRFAAAGSFMHFVMAIVLMAVLLAVFGTLRTSTTLDTVSPDRPAGVAGLRVGDKVVAINGSPITDWEQVREVISTSKGEQLVVDVERSGQQRSLTVNPVYGRTAEEAEQGIPKRWMVGIAPGTEVIKDSPLVAMWKAPFEIKNLTITSTKALFGLFTPDSARSYGEQLTKTGPADPEDSGNRLLSPVGMFRIGSMVADNGVDFFLVLLISINVFVGIFNMIPLPPFDGGHVAVATYEAIVSRVKGRRHMIDMGKLLPLAYLVVLAILFLGVSAAWIDIRHPLDLG